MEKNKKTDILKIIYFIRLNWKYLLSIPRSIYLNFRLLPLNQAIKVPIFFSNYTRVRICRNSRLIINSHEIHAGMIKIGYTHCDFFLARDYKSNIHLEAGIILFNGYANIGAGCRISIKQNAKIEFGKQFWSTGPILIIARKSVLFENNCVLSWNITIMDHDAHDIYVDNTLINKSKPIVFKNHCWVGCNSTILKGAIIPRDGIIAANSVITREHHMSNTIIAGAPGKEICKNVCWK